MFVYTDTLVHIMSSMWLWWCHPYILIHAWRYEYTVEVNPPPPQVMDYEPELLFIYIFVVVVVIPFL